MGGVIMRCGKALLKPSRIPIATQQCAECMHESAFLTSSRFRRNAFFHQPELAILSVNRWSNPRFRYEYAAAVYNK